MSTNNDIYYSYGGQDQDFLTAIQTIRNTYSPSEVDTDSLNPGQFTDHLINTLASSIQLNGVNVTSMEAAQLFSGYLLTTIRNGVPLRATPPDQSIFTGFTNYLTSYGYTSTPSLESAMLAELVSVIGGSDSGSTVGGGTGTWAVFPQTSLFDYDTNAINVVDHFLQSLDVNAIKAKYPETIVWTPEVILPIFIDNQGKAYVNFIVSLPISMPASELFTSWRQFITAVAVVDDNINTSTLPDLSSLPSFEAIYKGLGPPDATEDDFKAAIAQFYLNEVATQGYFLPSQAVGRWIQQLRSENSALVSPATKTTLSPDDNYAITGSSLDGNSSEKVLVLNRILLLLIQMLDVLQKVGIAQANSLNFTTQYQKAYTALQQQIPTFIRGGPYLGGGDTNSGQLRQDLNTQVNAILADNLRSLRGLQEDAAKRKQSDINQTNDAFTGGTDMISTFIQQMNALLSAIIR